MQQFITNYGYLAVFLLMLAESACIPIPSEVIMLFGGALAGGAVPGAHPSLAGIVIAGVLGNVVGSYLAWGVGRYAGQPAVRRWGRRVGFRAHDVDRATAWFERHGPAAVLFGRVIPVVRTFISLPAGFAAMPPVRFGVYTTLGCIPWTAALGIAGYAVGANWQTVANDFHGPTYAIAGIIAVALVAAVVLHIRRGRRDGGGEPATRGPAGQFAGQPPVGQAPGNRAPRAQGAGSPVPGNRAPRTQGPGSPVPGRPGPGAHVPGGEQGPGAHGWSPHGPGVQPPGSYGHGGSGGPGQGGPGQGGPGQGGYRPADPGQGSHGQGSHGQGGQPTAYQPTPPAGRPYR